MAGTKITLTLTPGEYDFIKRAVAAHTANQRSVARDSSTDAKLRQEARAEQARGEYLEAGI